MEVQTDMNKEKIAEFIGIMLGDGNFGVYKSKFKNQIKKQYRIKITIDSRDKQYIEYICALIEELFGVRPVVYYKKDDKAVDIGVYRKKIFYFVLNEIGLKESPKWNKMEIPRGYENGKLGLLVLKGLLDTDGCVSIFSNNGIRYPRIEIRLCPCPAQGQINKILEEFDFRYKIQRLERGKTRIRISGERQLRKWVELIRSSNLTNIRKLESFTNE